MDDQTTTDSSIPDIRKDEPSADSSSSSEEKAKTTLALTIVGCLFLALIVILSIVLIVMLRRRHRRRKDVEKAAAKQPLDKPKSKKEPKSRSSPEISKSRTAREFGKDYPRTHRKNLDQTCTTDGLSTKPPSGSGLGISTHPFIKKKPIKSSEQKGDGENSNKKVDLSPNPSIIGKEKAAPISIAKENTKPHVESKEPITSRIVNEEKMVKCEINKKMKPLIKSPPKDLLMTSNGKS